MKNCRLLSESPSLYPKPFSVLAASPRIWDFPKFASQAVQEKPDTPAKYPEKFRLIEGKF